MKTIAEFGSYPKSVRSAILFLCAGWLGHYGFYFYYYHTRGIPIGARETILMLAVGIGICYLVADLKMWARRLCLFFNIGLIGFYALLAVHFYLNSGRLGFLTGLIAGLFAVSTYYLLLHQTSSFFAATNPPAPDDSGSQGEPEPEPGPRRGGTKAPKP
jgi:hypothetical protein